MNSGLKWVTIVATLAFIGILGALIYEEGRAIHAERVRPIVISNTNLIEDELAHLIDGMKETEKHLDQMGAEIQAQSRLLKRNAEVEEYLNSMAKEAGNAGSVAGR